jgi:type VI secretion system secreted protein VgrG
MSPSQIAALFQRWTQTDRLMRLHTVLDAQFGPDILMAESMQAIEGVSPVDDEASQPDQGVCGFRIQLECLSLDAHLPLKQLIAQPVLLELMTDTGRTELRPFHGMVTACDIVGANAGLARYRLTIEPWCAFLRYGRDSAVFQDMTVVEIVEAVLRDYVGLGRLQPKWRLDILDPSVYPKRSLTTQYQESDLHFITRLLTEEGLFTYLVHEGDAASPDLGSHTLVIADHNGSFVPNRATRIAFTQPGAVMQRDSIDRWRALRRWQTNAVEVLSWDYRSTGTRPVAAHSRAADGTDATPLVSRDVPGVYGYETTEQGTRLAGNQMQAIEARAHRLTAAGTVRTAAPGTTFMLTGHADVADDSTDSNFLMLRVVHLAHNNLSAELKGEVHQRLGAARHTGKDNDAALLENADADSLAARAAAGDSSRPLYRNRIDAIPASTPYRAAIRDSHGVLIHPRPTVTGQQSAIVVGPPGQVIHTDRDHRIKLQFHWQRGAQSHSRLAHPNPDGHSGAPADESAGTWVRVMAGIAPTAGANWGGHAIPRIGQEVLVDFMEGDIDRPIVIGTLNNGRGQTDAQGNQVGQGAGTATGNAPVWFPGEAGAHAHPAVLSGIKTQAMAASQSGNGGYNQLVFDDSPGQSRAVLQQHASAHQGSSELNLGHLRHQTDNQRLDPAGFGFELKSTHSVALRAGAGMLISTDGRPNASGAQMDSREAHSQLDTSAEQVRSLAATAQQHKAMLPNEPAPEKIAAIAELAHSIKVLEGTAQGSGGGGAADTASGGAGTVTAYTEPHLQFSSPAGIAALTPADAILASGNTSSISAGHDINFAAQGNSHHLIRAGISLFTYGKVVNKDKPNQQTGIALHAASGKVSVQSQSDQTKITADKLITVASVTSAVNIAAKDHVLLTSGGAYLKIAGGNIEIHGPGAMAFKASLVELTGPGNGSNSMSMPTGKLKGCEQATRTASATQAGAQTL